MSEGERRLAAIMYTDIVGYTSLTQKDEALAMRLLEEHRRLVRPFFPKHNGREIKTVGDEFLVEFASALEAVRCAFDIQQSMHEMNGGRLPEKQVQLRIGVHLGDVIHSQNDVYGDAVNVASRIEPLAMPGGICISQQVYDHVKNKFEFPITSIGNKELKNVNEPTEVFRVMMPWERGSKSMELDVRRIAVLPFVNMSPDPGDEYFADGMTEELISSISNIGELSVISRTSAMRFKGEKRTASEIGQELKVGTLLEGSVRKADSTVRVTAQLIDVNSDRHLWAQNYDRELKNIFAVQSDIAKQVADSLRVRILSPEMERIEKRPTENTQAYSLYLKGRYYWNERNPGSIQRAMEYLEKAIQMDPSFALAHVGLADCYLVLIDQGVLEPNETYPKVRSLLDAALKLDDRLAEAHASLGNLLENQWDWSGAEAEYKRAIELNPNYATSHQWYSLLLMAAGRTEQGSHEINEALRLDPISPIVNVNVGLSLAEAGRFEEAIEQFRKTLTLEPNFGLGHAHLGEVFVGLDKYDEGVTELEKAIELMPENPWPKAMLAYAYGIKGDRARAQDMLRELEDASRTRFIPIVLPGVIYYALGEKEKALSLIQKAYEERSSALVYIKEFAIYHRIRADPQFKAVLDKPIGRPESKTD